MADYVLSPDGYSVVRKMPLGSVSAASLTIALPGGYTTTAGSGGSLTTSSYMEAFAGDRGGATIQALYTNTGLTAGQSLEWVQVITTNDPLSGSPGTTITYLDNGALPLNPNAPNFPFYTLTAANRQPTLAPTSLNFYDFSKRASTDVDLANPITWSANLYPVIVNGTSLTVDNGVSWGWTMTKAMVGTDSGIFTDPVNGINNIGVGTNTFSWGVPAPDQSSISFAPTAHFDTKPNTPFVLGSLTFHNGTISSGTGADAVTFDDSILFDNVPEKNFDLKTTFTLINTPNVTGDPHLDADSVQIGSFGYTFNVDEGATASVNIMAQLSTGLNVTPSGTSSGASPFPLPTLDPNPNYTLTIVGLAGPSTGGDVTNAPSTFAIAATDADKVALPTGTTAYTFAVTQGGDLSQAAALSYTVAGNGSNPAPQALFANPNGTVNFAAGQTTAFLTVNVNAASIPSPETFAVNLSNPPTATSITTASAEGTIESNNFAVDDRTTGSGIAFVAGDPYTGPVAGLLFQYINAMPDNLNVTPDIANTFVQPGSGFDAIDVSGVGGTNVLDGGTNSNFLVGGSGSGSFDTFFVDDRGPSADIWSTVANFHTGDEATIFGITPNGFNTSWVDGQGAAGYTGLTLHVTATGVPTASLTLSGFTTTDLTNGGLTTSYGTENDGTPYLYVHAN